MTVVPAFSQLREQIRKRKEYRWGPQCSSAVSFLGVVFLFFPCDVIVIASGKIGGIAATKLAAPNLDTQDSKQRGRQRWEFCHIVTCSFFKFQKAAA